MFDTIVDTIEETDITDLPQGQIDLQWQDSRNATDQDTEPEPTINNNEPEPTISNTEPEPTISNTDPEPTISHTETEPAIEPPT